VKNPIVLMDTKDIHRHVHGLWRSAPIRASHAEGGFIHDIVEQYARACRGCSATRRTTGWSARISARGGVSP
jgi:hypothetical protein